MKRQLILRGYQEPAGYWTKEMCIQDAKKYSSRSEWREKSSSSSSKARKNGWMNECTKHMTRTRKPRGYWTKEIVLSEASKYKSLKDWVKNNGVSINKARKNDWMNECTAHMK